MKLVTLFFTKSAGKVIVMDFSSPSTHFCQFFYCKKNSVVHARKLPHSLYICITNYTNYMKVQRSRLIKPDILKTFKD